MCVCVCAINENVGRDVCAHCSHENQIALSAIVSNRKRKTMKNSRAKKKFNCCLRNRQACLQFNVCMLRIKTTKVSTYRKG